MKPQTAIKAQVTARWCDLNEIGITGLLKGDTVWITDPDHFTSSEHGTCALAVNINTKEEWVIPNQFLKQL